VEQSIHELTTAIASGDTEAFARFYRAWFDRLYAEARRATGRDEAFCLDVVQDAMMRVIRSLKPLESEAALRAWLRRTVRSCAYDQLRKDSRRRRREDRSLRRPRPEPAGSDLNDRLAWLRRELQREAPESAGLLMLRHGFGRTLEQIGAVLGLSTGAVDGRLRRATAALERRAREDCDD
jgi:RNA polymerase sigma-70 factor (ECF subfamily)